MIFDEVVRLGKDKTERSKNTIQTYRYDWKRAIKLFHPKKKKIDVNDTENLKILDLPINEIVEKSSKLDLKKQKRIINIIIVLITARINPRKRKREENTLYTPPNKKRRIEPTKTKLDKLRQVLKDINLKIMDDEAKNEKTEKQKTNWISIEQYDRLVSRLNTEVKEILKWERTDKKSRDKFQQFVILKFYRIHHLRADLGDLRVITNKQFNALSKSEQKKQNYLVLDKRARYIILNDYKTKKQYKQIKIQLRKEIAKLMKKLIKMHDSQYLLVNQKGTRLTKTTFSTYFRRFMKKLTGKSVGVSLLRHIFISEKTKNMKTVSERKALAQSMLHSVNQQMLYNKID